MDEPIFFTTQDTFNTWMEEHSESANELWLGYFKKSSGHPSISWSDSVDVALCFGWIDGVRKSINEQSYKIRFTPRKPNSIWSAVNVEKAKMLIAAGKMRPNGLQLYNARKDKEGYTSQSRDVPLDPVYSAQLMANETAWAFFSSLAPSYQRDSIWWVMSAKKEETRQKRLGILISSSQDGFKIPVLGR